MSSSLPDFLFSGWRFRQDDVTEAKERGDLDGWTVSSLSSAYLKYQLDLYEEQRQANDREHLPSLATISIRKVLESLRKSENVPEEMKTLTVNMHFWPENAANTPYLILRLLHMSSATNIQGRNGIRKMIDIDEAILAGEQDIRSRRQGWNDSYLVTLEDLAIIFGSSDKYECITIKRKTPPKGSFEFLDTKRKPTVQIQGSDTSFIKTFNRVTKNLLKGLNWKNVFIQGGMVLNTLLHTDPTKDQDEDIAKCDIDLYLYDLTPQEANRKVEEIHRVYSSNIKPIADYVVIKTVKTISFIPKYPERRLQIVLKLPHAPLESLLRVDLDACAIGFDGTQVFMLPRCARAIETGYSVFTMDLIWGHRMGDRRETQTYRVFKYASRGFGLRILSSYVRSLEQEGPDDIVTQDQEGYPAEEAKTRSGSTSNFDIEPGLKTVRRIARSAHDFVARIYHEEKSRVTGSEYEEYPACIDLRPLDVSSEESGIPDVGNSIGVFEVFMRKCAAWRLSAMGLANLEPEEESTFSYGPLEIYDGLPTYKWNASSTADMDSFRGRANIYNNYLFGTLKRALAEKLQLHYESIHFERRERYLTQRVRRLIAGDVIGFVQAMEFALPLVIPIALETFLNELSHRNDDVPDNTLSEFLMPIHDPSRYRPIATRLPPLQDTWDESGNLRFWLISNERMWAGQHRALDKIAELLLMLFSWFTRNSPYQRPGPEPTYRTDDPQCIWYIADFFRRRLILPKSSSALWIGEGLSARETRLFRAWVLTRPTKRENSVRNSFDRDLERIENELDKEDGIEEDTFWKDGDEGMWDNEEGVRSWRESDDAFGLTHLSI